MAKKMMARSGRYSRLVVGALACLVIATIAVGSAFAFPTGNVTVGNNISIISGAETEYINVVNKYANQRVYMGPYGIPISGSPLEYMMCFNAGATATGGAFVATSTVGASAFFASDPFAEAKISMIAWLASQWQSPIMSSDAIPKNADINKAMWEIMADYDSSGKYPNSGLDLLGGSFFLQTGDSDITDIDGYRFLTDALQHTKDNTAANFLIPVISKDGKLVYDINRQPFAAPVPEPGTLLLLGSGLVGLGLHGWRKRSKAQK